MRGLRPGKESGMTSPEGIISSQIPEDAMVFPRGSLPSVFDTLFPEIKASTRDHVCSIIREISLYAVYDEYEGGYTYITGSAAKRILGGTPKGWETVNSVARQFLSDPLLADNTVLARLAHGGTKDLDIRFKPQRRVLFEEVVENVTETGVDTGAYTVTHAQFGGNKFATVHFADGFSLDLGETWDTAEKDAANCRISRAFPASEFCTDVCIDEDLRLWARGRYDREQYFLSDEVFLRFKYGTDLSQALIATQRVLLNHFWWKRECDYFSVRQSADSLTVREVTSNERFWDTARRNTEGREQLFDARRQEIAAGFILYLLCDPARFMEDIKRYHLIQFLPLREQLSGAVLEFDREAYGRKFSEGTLTIDESGLSMLAAACGITPGELIEQMYPVL
jgi:hypothetical protein